MTQKHDTAPAVRATGLVKTFGGIRAVDGIDLEVARRRGPRRARPQRRRQDHDAPDARDAAPDRRRPRRDLGVDVARHPHVVRQLVGLTGQYASVDENLTARENLFLFGRLLGLREEEGPDTGEDLLGRFGLEEAGDKQIKEFSGGMRRRLDLAASLIHRPPLIFLDEPTTGLDPRTRGQMWDTIRELVARAARCC